MNLECVGQLGDLLQQHSNKKVFFFDMDGTFINIEVIHSKACWQMIKELNPNKEVNGPEWFQESFTGLPDSKVFEILKADGLVPQEYDVRTFLDKKCDFFIQILDAVQLEEIFHKEIFEFISQAKKNEHKVGLVTASEGIVTHQILKKYDLARLFDIIVTRDDTSVSKPDPEPYLHAMRKLSVESNNCVIFEDSDTGFASATATDAIVYRVSWYQ